MYFTRAIVLIMLAFVALADGLSVEMATDIAGRHYPLTPVLNTQNAQRMTMKTKSNTVWMSAILILVSLLVASSGVVAGTSVSGDFSGEMVGYGDDANEDAGDFPHEISVEGDIIVQDENAVDPRIQINSGEFTTLDTSSVSIFVERGDADEFDTLHRADSVILAADEVEVGTTLRVEFTVIFKGGTFDDITPGIIEVGYETPGGTEMSDSFTVEEVTPNMEGVEETQDPSFGDLTLWQQGLIVIGGLSLVVLVLIIIVWVRTDKPPA